ncbi:MAG TPA: hypothetical protein EYF93_09205 [Planctomycetes bacterium]|nr:hypothetical protein [Planctomycetota bacterium]
MEQWIQGDGDLGDRIERMVHRALATTDRVNVLGADTPASLQYYWNRRASHCKTQTRWWAPTVTEASICWHCGIAPKDC